MYKGWSEIYKHAQSSLTNRENLIQKAAEQIEFGMDLVGATAIEDKL